MTSASVRMGSYLRSNWIRGGLVLAVIGAGPLLFIIIAAAGRGTHRSCQEPGR